MRGMNWKPGKAVTAKTWSVKPRVSAYCSRIFWPASVISRETDRQARATARLQRRCRPDLSDDEGPVRLGAQADDRVCRQPAPVGRAGLDGAGLQHPQPPPEDLGREHPASGVAGAVAPADRQHGDQGRKRRRKHGGPKRRVWRKIHLGINEQTLEGGQSRGNSAKRGVALPLNPAHRALRGVDKTWGSCGALVGRDGQPTVENSGTCGGNSVSSCRRPTHLLRFPMRALAMSSTDPSARDDEMGGPLR